ncbi:HNH endonuclease signature motif containing protein [Glycomyces algeriensis]|uniref:HNH endonuclease n=1 Tax=Glycomyces algeriensis TaxID=256037 RepID=A0A9W6LFY0_9ACTN|nr:HNH endonuclease signature motif containing protein [Glycomyces algeriensis]MDA1365864.1 HNH endonuclease signature motif containing protein [Glycomyces algeriensis]MDR7349371.1 hypothetical protein [Glycomyces algeriensis]GLI42073.1 hypothetical protein GALLR39Z86_19230 [Glycomyces algeriensis]
MEWADGGATAAENLILLCRFHHGRIHTTGWSVEKTGPGQAVITHHDHEGHDQSAPSDSTGCGCSDWRTDQDIDTEHQGSDWDVFPTGLYRSEWSEALKPDLDARAEAIDKERCLAAIKEAKAKCRERFGASPPVPVLGCPSGRPLGEAPQHHQCSAARNPKGIGPSGMPRPGNRPGKARTPQSRQGGPARHSPLCRRPIEPQGTPDLEAEHQPREEATPLSLPA